MEQSTRPFIPAAGHDLFLPLYDPLQKLLGVDSVRQEMVTASGLLPQHRVLDIGCGTGSLLAHLARAHPQSLLVGIDPDPKALRRARRKIGADGEAVQLDEAFADALPYDSGSFDRVFSCFMFHHLDGDTKRGTAREVRRVLAPGGSIHLLDFAHSGTRTDGVVAKLFHASESLKENASDRILELLAEAGFEDRCEVSARKTWFGRVAHFSGTAR